MENMDTRPLHNLPPRSCKWLIGREPELREILVKLGPETPDWVVAVEGIGGLGKTALALEAAWRRVEEYGQSRECDRFDVIIWAAASPPLDAATPANPAAEPAYTALEDVFRAVAAVLRIPTLMQVAPAERQKMCWAALQRQQRVLLIVDNLEEDEDGRIYSFLRDLPAHALVTTRFHEALPYPLRLAPLGESATRELLAAELAARRLAPAPSQLDALAWAAKGMPLAVRLLAVVCEQEGIDAALPRLSDLRSSLARGLLGQLAARLQAEHPAAHQTLLAAAFFDLASGVTAAALDATTGADASAGERARAWLNYVNLLTEGQGRYTILPITREYAAGELRRQPEWGREARGRWVAFYGRLAATLDDPAHYPAARTETANLLAVMRWLSENERFAELSRFFAATQEFLYSHSRWDELLDLANRLLAHAERAHPHAVGAETLTALMQSPVDIYRRRGQLMGEGRAWLDRLERLVSASTDRLVHAELHLARRRLLWNDGSLQVTGKFPHLDHDEIARYHNVEDPNFLDDMKAALRDFERAGRADTMFRAYATLGNSYRGRGEHERALRYYDLALATLEQRRPRTPAWREARAAVVRASQGLIAGRREDYARACEILRHEVLRHERGALIDEVDRAEALVALAYYERLRGNRAEAVARRAEADGLKAGLGLQDVYLCLEDLLWSERVEEAEATRR